MNKIRLLQIIIIVALAVPFLFIEGAFVLRPVENFKPNISKNYQTNSIGIYLINLDHATERLEKVMLMIDELGFPINRISAVDGKVLTQNYIDSITDYAAYTHFLSHEPEKGTIGCYLSHVKVWEEFLKSEYQYALIFEDDVSFIPKQIRQVTSDLLQKSNLWDICSFEILHRGWPIKIINLGNGLELAKYRFRVTHTGTYMINRKAAIQLLKYTFPIKMPVDHYFTRNWELGLKFTGIEPRISHQTTNNSYIKTHPQKHHHSNNIHRIVYEIKSGVMRFIYNF